MDGAHIHLLLNHFPIIGTLIASILLTASLIFKSPVLRRASLFLIIGLAIITIPVYLSGEEAEDVIEHAGVTHDYIEAHEEAGKISFYLMLGLGILAIFNLILDRFNKNSTRSLFVMVIFSWAVFADMVYVGNIGGQIKHDEIRGDAASVPVNTGGGEEDEHDHSHD